MYIHCNVLCPQSQCEETAEAQPEAQQVEPSPGAGLHYVPVSLVLLYHVDHNLALFFIGKFYL